MNCSVVFKQVTIIAPGLLGASLGKALHARSLAEVVQVWARRAETRLACASQPWCSAAPASLQEAVKGSDLVVLCTPVDVIIDTLREIAPGLKEGALVTDVGSTKSLICRQARGVELGKALFVGSHPMAGSEKTGLEHADAELFKGRACFVTPLEDAPAAAVEKIVRLWRFLDMEVTTVSPETHDEIVAHISHLPHFMASLLCAFLQQQPKEWMGYAGGGLRDTTRVASGSPVIWRTIAEHNREELLRALVGFDAGLQQLIAALRDGRMTEVRMLLENGKDYRDHLIG